MEESLRLNECTNLELIEELKNRGAKVRWPDVGQEIEISKPCILVAVEEW